MKVIVNVKVKVKVKVRVTIRARVKASFNSFPLVRKTLKQMTLFNYSSYTRLLLTQQRVHLHCIVPHPLLTQARKVNISQILQLQQQQHTRFLPH